ncbi:MAG: nucleotidyltransferase domain-containing protein [Bacteroidota bacterium]
MEIFLFLQQKYRQQDFDMALRYMVASQSVYNFDTFYSLKNDPSLIRRRVDGNHKATELLKTARRVSELLICFPYVRGIAISGSLSKNYADDDSDIDLFIITAKNRLWIARTMMHALKKLAFLFKKQHYFCMNYYVDEQQLQISEKNIYTATEVVTLIPLQGDAYFEQFFAANCWTQDYLPNNYLRLSSAKPIKNKAGKRVIEFLLNNQLGDLADRVLMKITGNRWNKKTIQKRLNMHGVVLSMSAGAHCAKPDPVEFQKKLITRYNDKISRLFENRESSMVY